MEDSTEYNIMHQQLLRDLKNTVEGLLMNQVPNVWSIYGGLNRLHNAMEKIFKHGCKEESNFLNFIQGLEWLQPDSAKSYFTVDCEYRTHIPSHLKDNKSSIWLYRGLETHSLSQKLSWLLSDKTHLLTCYEQYAFLCHENYAEATLICLRALERNQPSLLSEINPCLFIIKNVNRDYPKSHRRCSSFPDNHLKKIYDENKFKRSKTLLDITDGKTVRKTVKVNIQGKLKPWNSLPGLQDCLTVKNSLKLKSQSRTTPTTPVHKKKEILPSMLKVDYGSLQCRVKKVNSEKSDAKPDMLKTDYTSLQTKGKKANLKKCDAKQKTSKNVIINNIIEHTPSSLSSQHSSYQNEDLALLSTKSLPDTNQVAHSPRSILEYSFLPLAGEKDFKKQPRKSFIENGGNSVLPMATGFFPKPTKGQSLLSFLTSSQFSRANAELDRENAHFSISEAIISAMEQIKCKRDLKLADDESDPEILDLKQKIRLRRRQKFAEKRKIPSAWTKNYDDTTTTASPCSTTPDSLSDSVSSDDVDEYEIDQKSNLIANSGLSMSMASLYSEADLLKRPRGAPDGASDILSAEGVALSLISKFNEKQLPRASDLVWLVSEEDAPQALLPMPKSWPVNADEPVEANTPLRGTKEWAPPRPQIIFTIHSPPSRKLLMEKQNYRCSGCSMKVAAQYASRFRYCDYLGKYFCTGCHTNQLALIPGRVLQKWDFTRYPVSTFSYRLLEQMYTDKLFRVFELNKNIGKMSKNLLFYRKCVLGLRYLRDFILTCRFAEEVRSGISVRYAFISIQETLKIDSNTDPDTFSMDDLVRIRSGEMNALLKYLVELCCKHTSECKLCLARGFICEICNADEVIFPWQMRIVARCDDCGSCYHLKCWKKDTFPCPRCSRITQRKLSSDSDNRDFRYEFFIQDFIRNA